VNLAAELNRIELLPIGQLREEFDALFGEQPRSRNRQWLIKRIAWRMQANAEGDLSERARRRAAELANDADLRVTAPRERKPAPNAAERTKTVATSIRPGSELMPGTALARQYKGRTVRVTVLPDGFEHEGERYKSLTAVAQAVTGKHWNGFHFFGLRKSGGGR
jgi:hypothetical protein